MSTKYTFEWLYYDSDASIVCVHNGGMFLTDLKQLLVVPSNQC